MLFMQVLSDHWESVETLSTFLPTSRQSPDKRLVHHNTLCQVFDMTFRGWRLLDVTHLEKPFRSIKHAINLSSGFASKRGVPSCSVR